MAKDIEDKVQMLHKKLPNGMHLVVIGIPKSAMEHMTNGNYQNFNMAAQKIPVLLSVFVEKDGKEVHEHLRRVEAKVLHEEVKRKLNS